MPRYVPEDSLQSPRFTGPSTFARLPLVSALDDVDVAIVGVPFDTGVTYRVGGRFGPNAVRAASVMLRPYNPNLDIKPFDVLELPRKLPKIWNAVNVVGPGAPA